MCGYLHTINKLSWNIINKKNLSNNFFLGDSDLNMFKWLISKYTCVHPVIKLTLTTDFKEYRGWKEKVNKREIHFVDIKTQVCVMTSQLRQCWHFRWTASEALSQIFRGTKHPQFQIMSLRNEGLSLCKSPAKGIRTLQSLRWTTKLCWIYCDVELSLICTRQERKDSILH